MSKNKHPDEPVRVNIVLTQDTWKKFRKYCIDNDLIPSVEINKSLNKIIKKYEGGKK
jgi:hypothetical protein